jgi:hypothetical protein
MIAHAARRAAQAWRYAAVFRCEKPILRNRW